MNLLETYRGRRVLVTGHTGFKGGWLSAWLNQLGAKITGLALAPSTQPSLFDALNLAVRLDSRIVDIRAAFPSSASLARLPLTLFFILQRSRLAGNPTQIRS